MAIEVLDDKPDPSVLRIVICKNCGRKLRYAPIDVQSRVVTDYSGDSDTIYWIDCPCKAKPNVKMPQT